MLTIAEALQLDILHEAQVVAGHDGLHRVIAWVHNVGVPDAAHWLNGGELALTTVINMPSDAGEQKRYLQDIIDKGVAGLVVTIGQKLDHIPDYLCAIADAQAFPLIEIPYTARFVDIARTVNERIAQSNMEMVSRALTIHQTLTRIVLEGGGIKQLATTLAELVRQSISIENERFEALASVNIAAVDEARRYTQQYGRTDPRLVQALEDEILPEIRRTLRPVFIPAMPHVGLEMERILAPVVVHGIIYGYMWIIADDRPLSELDYMAIESGATIAALMMLYQESIQSAEASLKGNLLTRLIQGEVNGSAILTDQALRYGVDLRHAYRLVRVADDHMTTRQSLDLYRRVNSFAGEMNLAVIAGQFAGQVVLLTQLDNLDILTQRIHAEGEGIHIGISSRHSGADRVALAYAQCGEVLDISYKLKALGRTAYFDDLGYLHVLYHAGPQALKDNPYTPALRLLLDEQQADLFNTLETYLDVGGNGVNAAEVLHIHRSTLIYRLERIKEICKADLSEPVTRTNLQVALKLMRLFGM